MGLEQIKVELLEVMGGDRSIADSAWTSSLSKAKKEQRTPKDIERVITQMAAEGHGVPFESCIFKWWIYLPIYADRQHMTFRIASHSGLSGRYRTVPNDWYRLPEDVTEIMKRAKADDTMYQLVCARAHAYYRENLNALKDAEKEGTITNAEYKRAREVLRGAIPVSSMTERVTIMNLRSQCNYFRQRLSPHAQPEIRVIAEQMLELAKNSCICPISLRELEKANWRI